MRNKPARAPLLIGGSSLLTIFAVLCLTVFAVLSVATVQADRRLSQRTADAAAQYYAADCRAEELLARLRSGELLEGVRSCGGGRYAYDCPISDTQTLAVEVALDGPDYTILRWQAVSTARWQADDSLSVWDGEHD